MVCIEEEVECELDVTGGQELPKKGRYRYAKTYRMGTSRLRDVDESKPRNISVSW